jgi:hypothetical protein
MIHYTRTSWSMFIKSIDFISKCNQLFICLICTCHTHNDVIIMWQKFLCQLPYDSTHDLINMILFICNEEQCCLSRVSWITGVSSIFRVWKRGLIPSITSQTTSRPLGFPRRNGKISIPVYNCRQIWKNLVKYQVTRSRASTGMQVLGSGKLISSQSSCYKWTTIASTFIPSIFEILFCPSLPLPLPLLLLLFVA